MRVDEYDVRLHFLPRIVQYRINSQILQHLHIVDVVHFQYECPLILLVVVAQVSEFIEMLVCGLLLLFDPRQQRLLVVLRVPVVDLVFGG